MVHTSLINYLLGAKAAEKLTLAIGYPTANLEAKKALPKEITEDPSIYPTAEILQKSHWQDDVGDAIQYYEQILPRVKRQQNNAFLSDNKKCGQI